ncbi:4-hydroxy-tetrahydrodipicolinate reductase [Candidatus Spongiihabitans sp.]|uniref:4-hydroxy-tetrahydrodipicolinate reductase n=1 Tax=Candidatus Spongiihabitans sp. TaxID=3101308 RepID=UPI003C6F533F
MIKLAISGASGRMGRAIIRELDQSGDMEVAAALEHKSCSVIGQDAGQVAGRDNMGVPISANVSDMAFDVMIDFSKPEAVPEHLELCKAGNAAIVIGTTGLNESQNQQIADAASHIPVLFAANTSVGINLCVSLIETASKVIGNVTDIEIIESHHRHKVDAPSGTALLLGEAAAGALATDLSRCGVFSREGHTGERKPGSIGFATIRGGDIAGEHTVMFIGDGERIEITHMVTDRKIFAQGAIRAAHWLSTQQKGLFNMQDALDLR